MDLRSFVVVLRSLRRRFADQGAPWTYVIARPSWPGVSWTRLRFVDNPLSKLNINRVSESARLPVFRGVSQSEIAHVIQSLIFPSILTFSEILFHSPLTTHLPTYYGFLQNFYKWPATVNNRSRVQETLLSAASHHRCKVDCASQNRLCGI